MPTYGPSHELTRRLIEVFTADDSLQEMLFPAWSSVPVTPDDKRIYNAHAAIDDPKLLVVLPRLIIETVSGPQEYEQPDVVWLSAPVTIWIHSIVPKDQYDLAELMDARIRTIIGSTVLTSSRIIASGLYEAMPRRRTVETGFNDAWRITSSFMAPNVGVLAT